MADAQIRPGDLREGFFIVYHELYDLYHDYIGDKALLYYTFLLRYRHTKKDSELYGKSWNGRRSIVEKFQISYSVVPLLDDILIAAGLIDIETKPSGRGRDKIYYVVHDPKIREEFRFIESRIKGKLLKLMEEKEDVKKIIGKAIKPKRNGRNTK
ncbi:MAG: hypothetical protein ACQEV7_16355 [Bacillota bacterium]